MKVSINNPCHENWDAMTPNEQGAFCLACQKTVVDFSRKSTEEIKDFFKVIPASEKVCGRFKVEQLKEISFEEFFVKFKNWILPKKVAVVLFFCFGISLFSCRTTHEPLMGDVAIETQIPLVETEITNVMGQNDTAIRAKTTSTIVEEPKYKMGEVMALPPENKSDNGVKCAPKDTLIKEDYIKGKVKLD